MKKGGAANLDDLLKKLEQQEGHKQSSTPTPSPQKWYEDEKKQSTTSTPGGPVVSPQKWYEEEKPKKVEDPISLDLTHTSEGKAGGSELEKLRAEVEFERKKQEQQEVEALRKELEMLRSKNTNFHNTTSSSSSSSSSRSGSSSSYNNNNSSSLSSPSSPYRPGRHNSRYAQRPQQDSKAQISRLESQLVHLKKESAKLPGIDTLQAKHAEQAENVRKIQFGVDVCFLMDCTGSMKPWIKAARNNIVKIIAAVKDIDAQAIVRFAFVGYRDYADGDKQYEWLDFIDADKVGSFQHKLGQVVAGGGGDMPEDVAGGLDLCIKLSWRASTRLLIHTTDAPCHGEKYHTLKDDSYPGGDPRGLIPEDLLRKLINLRVDYYFLKMTVWTDQMIAIFKAVYDEASKTFQEHNVGTSPALFLPKVVNSIHSSMARSYAGGSVIKLEGRK